MVSTVIPATDSVSLRKIAPLLISSQDNCCAAHPLPSRTLYCRKPLGPLPYEILVSQSLIQSHDFHWLSHIPHSLASLRLTMLSDWVFYSMPRSISSAIANAKSFRPFVPSFITSGLGQISGPTSGSTEPVSHLTPFQATNTAPSIVVDCVDCLGSSLAGVFILGNRSSSTGSADALGSVRLLGVRFGCGDSILRFPPDPTAVGLQSSLWLLSVTW